MKVLRKIWQSQLSQQSPGTFEQYTLLNQLSDAVKAKTQPCDNAMIVDEPVKPVAGSSKHPDNTDIIDGELIY